MSFRRIGSVNVPFAAGPRRLELYWMAGYAGGLFLPFRDATNGAETYGAGRYLLDSAKSADLGPGREPGSLVLDFNFAFQPSCAFDPKYACPLAPPTLGLNAMTKKSAVALFFVTASWINRGGDHGLAQGQLVRSLAHENRWPVALAI